MWPYKRVNSDTETPRATGFDTKLRGHWCCKRSCSILRARQPEPARISISCCCCGAPRGSWRVHLCTGHMARCQVRGRRGQHLPTRKYHPVGILFLRADKGDVIITTAGSWGVRMVYYWISHTQFSRTFHACLPDIKHRIKGPIPTGPIYYHRLPPSTTDTLWSWGFAHVNAPFVLCYPAWKKGGLLRRSFFTFGFSVFLSASL